MSQPAIAIHGPQYEYAFGLFAGMTAALTIAPIIMIVDKSVMLSANGKKSLPQALLEGIKGLLRPMMMVRSFEFQWIFLVYLLTYVTSNTSHLLFSSFFSPILNPAMTKLLATFIVNTVTSMMKDKALAQKLGTTKPRPFPTSSLILFLIRDIIAMASAFTIPAWLAMEIHSSMGYQYENSLKVAQILSPMMVQFVNTFVQLFALDLYNREGKGLRERVKEVGRCYGSSLAVRMVGFTAAYGIGGIVNLEVKAWLVKMFGTF